MNFADWLVVVRGGGDLATGVVYRLHQAGFPVVVLELAQPLVVRRRVAVATAVLEGEIAVENLIARRVGDALEALDTVRAGIIPVLVAPEVGAFSRQLSAISFQLSALNQYGPYPVPGGDSGQTTVPAIPIAAAIPGAAAIPILIDARMAKRNIDTTMEQAQLVVALGPGFTAGVDCHAVVETMRGHHLGRVIWSGSAVPNTGTPGIVEGKGAERVLRAPAGGSVKWQREIGDQVKGGELLGEVDDESVIAPFEGVLRGLIASGTVVRAGLKIGDLDPRADVSACFTISDKALAIGGGVLESVLTYLNRQPRSNRGQSRPGRPQPPALSLRAALDLHSPLQMVAFTGGGGKTSLLFALARELREQVVTTTTTRIFTAQMALAPAIAFAGTESEASGDPAEAALEKAMGVHLARFGHCLVVGELDGEKALGVTPDLPARLLARPDVDYLLVEADGSRLRPCKAPAEHEPVIPPETNLVVPVAGIDAVGGRLADVAHRPERVAQLTGLAQSEPMTAAALARLLSHTGGGLKGVPAAARVIPFINKVESEEELLAAREIARLLLREERIHQVVLGAVQTARPVREVHRRVTAVVLAAGEARRMGRTKQLLPWGDTTVLGRTLRNLQQSAVHDIVVVTGHEAEKVAAVSAAAGVASVHNPNFVLGEMLSSLQVAVRQLAPSRAAVLVVLADQPLIGPETIDRILHAYWQGKGHLVAPVHRGRRGNPVLIDRAFFAALLALPPGAAPRDLLRQYRHQLHLVEVASDNILRDLDLPADYERWHGEEGNN
jgi:probable selenium-dependent hydroxylase accessory protein YqeC